MAPILLFLAAVLEFAAAQAVPQCDATPIGGSFGLHWSPAGSCTKRDPRGEAKGLIYFCTSDSSAMKAIETENADCTTKHSENDVRGGAQYCQLDKLCTNFIRYKASAISCPGTDAPMESSVVAGVCNADKTIWTCTSAGDVQVKVYAYYGCTGSEQTLTLSSDGCYAVQVNPMMTMYFRPIGCNSPPLEPRSGLHKFGE